MKREAHIQRQICRYIALKYPDVIFESSLSGMKMTMGQAINASKIRSDRGYPDLIIDEPVAGYHGLRLEIKKEGTKIFLKDGKTPVADRHLSEQKNIIKRLQAKGYYSTFGIGLDECMKIVDNYFNFRL